MLTVQLDKDFVEKRFQEELKKRLDSVEQRLTYWDMKELQKQTNMSINTIKEKFFYDKRFPKYRVGSKWYFPARDCEEFLYQWLKEQMQE